ncbi:MAG: type II toxin-antitoxin system RelE/ParE family toxin [Patescibacteria group bacterium]
MKFEISFYKDSKGDNPIEDFLLELGKSNKILTAKTRQGIAKLKNREYHKEPLSKHLESGLWELRIRAGNDILRIIYTFSRGRVIILLHIFIKKKQKTQLMNLKLQEKD